MVKFRVSSSAYDTTKEAQKLCRFLAAGLANASAGFLLFVIFFNMFRLHYLAANVLVFMTWTWFGYELQRRWAFQAPKTKKGLQRYVLNQIGFAIVASGLLWLLVEQFSVEPNLAYLISLGFITVGIYLASRLWIFRPPVGKSDA